MIKIDVAGRKLGAGEKVFIIAEACDNHLGSIDTAYEMIRQAKKAGADAIKFQHHLPDEEMLKDVPSSENFEMPLYDFLIKYSLSLDDHIALKKYCDDLNILYLCTPFSLKAALEINPLVPAFKIGSGEMTDIPTLARIASLNKPMIISTGMSTFEEIGRTYGCLIKQDANIVLLNCVSEYPPVYEDLNLGVISKMQELFPKAIIGHSDHTDEIYSSLAAVALGAKVIEKHVILDKNQKGPDQSVSITFDDLSKLVDGIRKIEVALGSDKCVHRKEIAIREWAFRSIVSTNFIPKGSTIQVSDVWSKRPGTGIPSHEMEKVIGAKAKVDIQPNTLLCWEDLDLITK